MHDDSHDFDDDDFDPEFDDDDYDDEPLDDHETELIRQDLDDLESFELAFSDDGYRGVSVFCRQCVEEHFYPWDMLRENLTTLLATGETPVHEPAFSPDPADYVPWEYALGYVAAMRDLGVAQRRTPDTCGRCDLVLGEAMALSNFCPRCGQHLGVDRLRAALEARLEADDVDAVLRESGMPR